MPTITKEKLASMIEHTCLKPDATVGDIEKLCEEAQEHSFHAVMVNPVWVPLAADILAGSKVKVGTVIGFPLGANRPELKRLEALDAFAHGATELDYVMDIGALKAVSSADPCPPPPIGAATGGTGVPPVHHRESSRTGGTPVPPVAPLPIDTTPPVGRADPCPPSPIGTTPPVGRADPCPPPAPPAPPQTPMRRFLDSLSLSMAIEPGCIRKGEVVQKLIIECCCLTNEEKLLACRLAKEAGFDFVKTSTGFAKGGATVEDVRLMSSCVGRGVGVKAAGGIRTLKDALAMIEAGATRIGTSSGIKILSEMD